MDVANAGNPGAAANRPRNTQRKLTGPADQTSQANTTAGNQDRGSLRLPTGDVGQLSRQAGERRFDVAQPGYQRPERNALQIRTREGDVIRLRFASQHNTQAQATPAIGSDRLIAELALVSSPASRLQLSVQGDLSKAELSAIRSVLNQAGSLANEFLRGDLQGAFSTAAALQIDGQSLARVSLKPSAREQLALVQTILTSPASQPRTQTATELAVTPQGDRFELTDATLVRQPTANPTLFPTLRTDLPLPASPTVERAAVATGDDTTSDQVEPESGSSLLDAIKALADLLDGIARFLGSLVDTFKGQPSSHGAAGKIEGSPASFDLSFKLKVFQAVIGTVADASAGQEDAGLTLLAETVEAIDATVQPPLDTRV
jgi:hypothetical protein